MNESLRKWKSKPYILHITYFQKAKPLLLYVCVRVYMSACAFANDNMGGGGHACVHTCKRACMYMCMYGCGDFV